MLETAGDIRVVGQAADQGAGQGAGQGLPGRDTEPRRSGFVALPRPPGTVKADRFMSSSVSTGAFAAYTTALGADAAAASALRSLAFAAAA